MYTGSDCFVCGGVPRVYARSRLDGALYAYCLDCGGPYAPPGFDDIPRVADFNEHWESRFADPVGRAELTDLLPGRSVRLMERCLGRDDMPPTDEVVRDAVARASRYRIDVRSPDIAVLQPDGTRSSVPWEELRAVVLENRGDGPPVADTWVIFEGDANQVAVPLGTRPEEQLLFAFSRLPWFDIDAYSDVLYFPSSRAKTVGERV